MIRITVRRRAAFELAEVVMYYEGRSPGLGRRFERAVEAALADACEMPARFPFFYGSQRRIIVPRFPFAVTYLVDPAAIIVTAVVDLRGDPRTIEQRLSDET